MPLKGQTQRINEVILWESEEISRYRGRWTYQNHDLQVRCRWGEDDGAIVSLLIGFLVQAGLIVSNSGDDRSTYHTATKDLGGSEIRTGR